MREITEEMLPNCEDCGEKCWNQGTYHDFYCGNCGNTLDVGDIIESE